jgi:ribosomal protein S18 acetylase RimI-like enzyme
MSFVIRPARADDVAAIAEWTQNTFVWGDYVAEMLPGWLDDPDSLSIVCVYEDDFPVALSRVQMLSATEGWLSAARVHPDHRRAGMASAMNEHSVEWARSRGAVVARLATEESNQPARRQVLKLGYRETGRWVHATAEPPDARRLDTGTRLKPALAIDADAAWTFWSRSDLALAGRELLALGWRWRRATKEDLDAALEDHSLQQSPAGWVIVVERDDGLMVGWMATSMADAPLLIEGLLDLARERKKPLVEMMVPALPWVTESLLRAGFEVSPILVYSRPV